MNRRFSKGIWWVVFLFGVWLLLTKSLDSQSIFMGLAAAVVITFFNLDKLPDLKRDFRINKNTIGKWTMYMVYLIIEIFKAGWQVAKLAFAKKPVLAPRFITYNPKVHTPTFRVIFANAITLTPGTLTVEAPQEGSYIIHVLTDDAALGLKDWHIEERLAEIERTVSDA